MNNVFAGVVLAAPKRGELVGRNYFADWRNRSIREFIQSGKSGPDRWR